MSFGNRLDKLIKELGYDKTRQFADDMGINEGNLSSMINNKRPMSMGNLLKILENIDGLNVKWLMLGEGDIFFSNGKVFNYSKDNNGINIGEVANSNVSQESDKSQLLSTINLLEQEVRLLRRENETLRNTNERLLNIVDKKL